MTFDEMARLVELTRKAKQLGSHQMDRSEARELVELEAAADRMRAAAAEPAAELQERLALEAKQRRERAERVVNSAIGVLDFGLTVVGGIFGKR